MNLPRGGLPDITFADSDPSQIVTRAIRGFEAITGETLAPADPRRLFIQSLCSVIVQLRKAIDYSAKQNLLSYATESSLDHLGYMTDTPRLEAQSALTTFEFRLSTVLTGAYTIPAGTQITTGNNVIFQTDVLTEIPPGSLSGTVSGHALVPGVSGNGFLPGQINALITPLPYVASVSNLTESNSGADREDDDNYAERIQLSPEKLSTAGPEDSYKYWTRTANQNIKDVNVYTPAAGTVEIRCLLKNGDIPSDELLEQIGNVLSATNIRPFTDHVIPKKPDKVDYDISIKYWISTDDKSRAALIQSEVNKALVEYKLWQRSVMGRDINPDEIISRFKNAGAKRLEITSPVFTVISEIQAARERNIECTYEGLEDG
ncbi:baseplate J/gp47 family protein [Salmonella enterica]|nr:baseplate J/gp47 family protein [Salmonella enterica]EDL5079983.1 baseplate J protein [Salmonella enterica subsp. enterica serovar Muenchen]EEJ4591592.1 baseplate J/gp47 family protein [Salmonella enterica subsp. salamae serovar 47:b:e,n,x,z15]EDB2181912.1 baseplate J/gp47 family protein [Salmonella enterica]EDC3738012.1 baseplate J/gp47 family protein [Salmonella enterica]